MNAPFRLPGTPLDPSNPINRGLVGWWPMWEGAGGKTLDISGNNNHGTLTNGPLWAGGGLSFDGANDYIAAGGADIPPPATMAAWVYLNARSGIGAPVFGKSNNYNSFRAEQYGSDAVGITIAGVVDAVFSSPGYTVPLQTWTLLATNILSGTAANLYVNGRFSGSLTVSSGLVGWRDRIGADSANFINGRVSNPRVWSRTLSAGEHAQLYVNPNIGLWVPDITRYYIPAAGGADVRSHIIPAYMRIAA